MEQHIHEGDESLLSTGSTLTWTLSHLSSTVEVDRYGEVVNSALTGYLTPTTLVNLSVTYKLGEATFGVIVNNLLDTV